MSQKAESRTGLQGPFWNRQNYLRLGAMSTSLPLRWSQSAVTSVGMSLASGAAHDLRQYVQLQQQ